MDNAVALVQTYLRLNGYFTVAEYPILEATRGGGYQTATDLDILAFRFPHAGMLIPRPGRRSSDKINTRADPALGAAADHADMLVGEVKEGAAVVNDAASRPAVLHVALVRFGCCSAQEAPPLVTELLQTGHALLPVGHQIRMVAFGSTAHSSGRYHTVSLGHALQFIEDYLREHWDLLRHVDHKDPVFGFLSMMAKAKQGIGAEIAS